LAKLWQDLKDGRLITYNTVGRGGGANDGTAQAARSLHLLAPAARGYAYLVDWPMRKAGTLPATFRVSCNHRALRFADAANCRPARWRYGRN
jgi:hypothetical protein